MSAIDLKGQRFGRLVVIERAENDPKGRVRWKCQCDCGNTKIVKSSCLRNGMTNSCGCLQKERTRETTRKHGMRKERIFLIWCDMKTRCFNDHYREYHLYGGRGITVCDEWKNDFMNFYNWAIENGYRENLTIDRKNVDGNYEPSNCRWATLKEQANNRRSNRFLTVNGETHTMTEWAEKKGIRVGTLHKRLKDGWDVERAVNTPVGKGGNHEK